jgi:hypothetical protein
MPEREKNQSQSDLLKARVPGLLIIILVIFLFCAGDILE